MVTTVCFYAEQHSIVVNLHFNKNQDGDVMEINKSHNPAKTNHQLETIGLMASGIVHDFNNLLTSIVGQTSLALATLPPDNEARIHIERVVKAAEFGSILTNQLLKFASDQQLIVENVDINDLILNNQALFRMLLDHNIQLVFELDNRLPTVVAIRSQIQQVLMNLVVNAVHAIAEDSGHIVLRTSEFECSQCAQVRMNNGRFLLPGRYLRIQVEDTGSGIDASTLPKIFSPFYSTRSNGSGLGLTSSLEIIQQHNGGILVTSTKHVGTTAAIFLPLCLKLPVVQ